jgi:hypothetical protein
METQDKSQLAFEDTNALRVIFQLSAVGITFHKVGM